MKCPFCPLVYYNYNNSVTEAGFTLPQCSQKSKEPTYTYYIFIFFACLTLNCNKNLKNDKKMILIPILSNFIIGLFTCYSSLLTYVL